MKTQEKQNSALKYKTFDMYIKYVGTKSASIIADLKLCEKESVYQKINCDPCKETTNLRYSWKKLVRTWYKTCINLRTSEMKFDKKTIATEFN